MADVRELKDRAAELFSKGRFAKAAEAYEAFCQADQKDSLARLRMGDAWSKAGKKEKAIAAYKWAAEGFAKEGFLPRAIAASKLILELDPRHKGVQHMLAELYARKSSGARPGGKQAPAFNSVYIAELDPISSGWTSNAHRPDAVPLETPVDPNPPGKKGAVKPAEAPSPLNRKDAIDLPEYDLDPAAIGHTTVGGMSAPVGPSPTTNARAIELEVEPEAATGPADPAETKIEIELGGRTVTGEIEIPILGEPLPAEAARPERSPGPTGPAQPVALPPPAAPPAGGYELDVLAAAQLTPPQPGSSDSEPLLLENPLPREPAPPSPKPAAPSFTELELEGDSLLHAVEAAASRTAEPPPLPPEEAAIEGDEDARPDPGALPKIPLFSDLPEDAFIALFEQCPLRRVEPGKLVVEQGSKGDSFFVICSGAVKVYRTDQGVRRELAKLEEGAFFGEVALLSEAPRTASVEACQEDTQLLEISAPVLTRLSAQYPAVSSALKKFCRQRLLTNLMSSAALFRPFTRSDRRELVQRFRAREVGPGETLVQEGKPSDGLYVVLSGEVEVRMGERRVATLHEGDVFGEMSLLTRSPATASVRALRRTSLLRLPHQDFTQIIMSHPQVLELISELTDARTRANAELAHTASATTSMI